MNKQKYMKLALILSLLLLVSACTVNNNNFCQKLSTDQLAWESCREIAWNECMMTESVDIENFYYQGGHGDHFESMKPFEPLLDLPQKCWSARFDLCDAQFDMNEISTVHIRAVK